MENAIVDILQLNENSNLPSGSLENKKKYVSCIKINGKPILPPLISEEKKKELNMYKQKAIEIELKLLKQKNKASNQTSSEVSSLRTLPPSHQSTPTRPATLSLLKKQPEKTNILSKSKTEGSLNQFSDSELQTVSSQQSSRNLPRIFKSSLEQRLATEENVSTFHKLSQNQQFPIIEEQYLDVLDKDSVNSQLGRWSPLKVEQLNTLKIELSNKDLQDPENNLQLSQEENQTTPETVTQSPNLMRQNSYTLLTPSPALLSFLESQKKEKKAERSNSGRKTWDLKKAKKNWNSKERKGCRSLDEDESSDEVGGQCIRQCSSSLDDFFAVENNFKSSEYSEDYSVANDSVNESPNSFSPKKSVLKLSKIKSKGKVKKSKFLKGFNLPNGNDKKVPFKKNENILMAIQDESDFVPSDVKTELSKLTNLFTKMKVDHERQKKELEEKQQTEIKQLELIFQRKEAELLEKVERFPCRKPKKSIYSESLRSSIGVKEEISTSVMGDGHHNQAKVDKDNGLGKHCLDHFERSPRPHSAKSLNRQLFSPGNDNHNRRTKSMDYSEANQDTDLDFSFQDDFLPSKDTTLNNEYLIESDSISNFSSRSSTISSENRPDVIPSVHFRKYYEISGEEYARYNQAATIITAAAKGFLTRRLLRTAHVQGLITTLKDAITCATQLHTASDIGDSDIDLMRRLGRQIEAAWDAVYVVFFNTDIPTKMQLIAADRERLKATIAKIFVADPKKKRISSATRKSLDRKRASTLMSKSQTSTNGCTRVRMCSKMTASYPSPYYPTKLK